jgi:hypothetical protein
MRTITGEDTVGAAVRSGVRELVRVTSYKTSVNSVTTRNPVFSNQHMIVHYY